MQKILMNPSKVSLENENLSNRVGHTLEEFKSEKSQALSADVAPLSTKALQDLIGNVRTNSQARLNVPSPINYSPNLKRVCAQDYSALQRVLFKSSKSISRELNEFFEEGVAGLPRESIFRLKNCLNREEKMINLLKDLADSMSGVHIRMVSVREG